MGGKRRELKVTVLRRGGQDRDAIVERIVRRVASEIMSTRLVNTLRITVECRATTLEANTHGTAKWTPVENVASKHYRIVVLRDADLDKLARTIAHEVRHVEQFARGHLRHGTMGGVAGRFWRHGEGRATFHPYATTDYWTSPWEVEARATEDLGTRALARCHPRLGTRALARRLADERSVAA